MSITGKSSDDLLRVLRRRREQVALGAEAELHRRDDLFADRVQRRVRDLRELLREVVEQQARALARAPRSGVSEPMAPSGSAPF